MKGEEVWLKSWKNDYLHSTGGQVGTSEIGSSWNLEYHNYRVAIKQKGEYIAFEGDNIVIRSSLYLFRLLFTYNPIINGMKFRLKTMISNKFLISGGKKDNQNLRVYANQSDPGSIWTAERSGVKWKIKSIDDNYLTCGDHNIFLNKVGTEWIFEQKKSLFKN